MPVAFGPFVLDGDRFELRRDGARCPLQPKAMRLLLHLVEQRARVVTKDELFALGWPGQAPADAALNTAIRSIRRALGDDAREQRWIQTAHTQGYRFVGALAPPPADAEQAAGGEPADALRPEPPAPPLPAGPPVPAAAAAPREHKQVSVLCCSWHETVAHLAPAGAEAVDRTMRGLQSQADALVARFGGTLLQRSEAGCTALFGAPQAHEDHARRALLAGLALAGTPAPPGAPRAAVGVHGGPVVVGTLAGEGLYVAPCETLRLAREAAAQAAAGELWASDATVAPLRSGLRLAPQAAARDAAGAEGPAAVLWQVLGIEVVRGGVPQAAAAARMPFVGRDIERALLDERLEAARSGRGQVVAIVGEAGIGKSRLLGEFRDALPGAAAPLEAHCLPYAGAIAYHPVTALLRGLAGAAPGEAPALLVARLASRLPPRPSGIEAGATSPAPAGAAAAATAPRVAGPAGHPQVAEATALLAAWLGAPFDAAVLAHLSPQAQRERAFELTVALALGAGAPSVVLFEDLHWIDPESEDWLRRLAAGVPGAAALLVVTLRPEARPAWLDAPWVTRLALPPLSPAASLRLMRSTAAPGALSPAAAEDIARRAAGNPFFVEELSRALDGRGLASVPGSVMDVLAARIDRLAPQDKHLLQVAALVGAPLPLALWQSVAGCSAEALDAALERLQQAGFVFATGGQGASGGVRGCVFKHALTQEVAYRSMLDEARRPLHERTARALEAEFPAVAAEQPERLARHYAEAGALREAALAWRRASRRAYERSAHALAAEHAREGLRALAALPAAPARDALELRLQLALGPALMSSRGYADPAVRPAWERARVLAPAHGDAVAGFKALIGLWNYHWVRGEIGLAVERARELLGRLGEDGDAGWRLRAHAALGETLFHQGAHREALQQLERATAAAQDIARPGLASGAAHVIGLSYCAWTRWHLGEPAAALALAARAVGLARGLRHPLSLAVALSLQAGLLQFEGLAAETALSAAEAAALSREQGFPFWEGTALVLLGWATACRDDGQGADVEAGRLTLARGLEVFHATGARVQLSAWLRLQAEVLARAGETAAAQQALDEALAWAARTGERYVEPEIWRLRARGLAQAGETAAAEAACREATALAQAQGALGLARRTALDWAGLLRAAGRADEARTLLAPWADAAASTGAGELPPP